MTGLHTVADIYCTCCNTVLGWKYVSSPIFQHEQFESLHACLARAECVSDWLQEQAFEETQKYKEGKFIIEKSNVMKVHPTAMLFYFSTASYAQYPLAEPLHGD